MAILSHESFRQPADVTIALWRYMDLSKFAALLQKRALVFSRADKLGDPFEGSVPEPNAKALDYIRSIREHMPEKDPFPNMKDGDVRDMFSQLSILRQRAVKGHYISCWHMNESESAGMWKLYSRSSDAVCVRTDYQTLATVLPDESFLGLVDYVDFRTTLIPVNNIFSPFLTKRRSFSHEREARAIIVDYETINHVQPLTFKYIQVDLRALVKQVFVSPEASDWFRDVVADLVAKYDLSVSVEHSEMNAIPLY
jgi:hypothetical protein